MPGQSFNYPVAHPGSNAMAKDPEQLELLPDDDPSMQIPDGETHSDPVDEGNATPPTDDAASEEATPPPVDPEPQPEWHSLRDAAKEAGMDLPGDNDEEAFKHLLGQATKAREYEELLAQQQAQLQAQLLNQQQQQQPEPPKEPEVPLEQRYWNAPDYDPTWLRQVQQGEDGTLQPVAGASPDVVAKLQNWATFQQQQQDRFWQNPVAFMRPIIEAIADEKARGQLDSFASTFQENQAARDIIAQNAEWMVERTPEGKTSLTAEGKVYDEAIKPFGDLEAERQHQIGMMAVNAYRAQNASSQQTAVETHEKLKEDAVATPPPATRAPNAGSNTRSGGEDSSNLSLEQLLQKRLTEAGVTDEMIAASYSG
jgi:hypothetical protein